MRKKRGYQMYRPVIDQSTKHYGSNFWDCYSHKINRDVHFYSELEYEHWIHVETNPKIVDFCEKPLKVKGIIDNKVYESTFDMWIKWQDGREEFIEVTYAKGLNHSKSTQRKIQIQKRWCNENNYKHRIMTEGEIRIQPLLKNLKVMLPNVHRFNTINEIEIYKIMNMITETPKTFQSILIDLKPAETQSFYKSIMYLFYSGQVKIDIDENLFSLNSKVWLKNG